MGIPDHLDMNNWIPKEALPYVGQAESSGYVSPPSMPYKILFLPIKGEITNKR